ncbi:ABC transporter permease, partial [Eubacteriales bacterium OttesenSCG-928-M02]|nr:ABC transporter permease [Eubacteriales bacterium OttesenSCG-928-M02]
MKRSFFSAPYLIWMLLFTLIPLVIVGYYAFTVPTADGVAFTFENIKKALDPLYLNVLGRSLFLAFVATIFCILIGYPVAMVLTAKNFKRGSILVILFILPMWMNFLLRTYALINILDTNGVIAKLFSSLGMESPQLLYNTFAIVLGLVYNYLPFMILPIYTSMNKIDKNLIEAAEDLGSNSFNVFRRVKFPLSLPGVISGIVMVF